MSGEAVDGGAGRFPRIDGEGGPWGKQGFRHGSEPKASDAHAAAASTGRASSACLTLRTVVIAMIAAAKAMNEATRTAF